jgi:hypothetical protein
MNDNVFEWSVALVVLNPDSLYYGGYFKAKMTFPRSYPHSPPGTSLQHPGTRDGKKAPSEQRLTHNRLQVPSTALPP